MKHLLIITGPQGSGNHLFSRILSQHPDVQGWDAMLEQYWVPSDQEPFAEYWIDPDRMQSSHFDGLDYHLANVSCPFFFDGVRHVPDIVGVARRAESFGVQVKIAIIVRDQNINQVQQLRVRGAHTTPVAQEYYYNTLIPSGFPVHFLDHEAFFLHRQHYMAWVGKMLDFPVSTDPDVLNQFISQDANHKYIKYIDEHWLDELILAGCKPTRNERLNDTPSN